MWEVLSFQSLSCYSTIVLVARLCLAQEAFCIKCYILEGDDDFWFMDTSQLRESLKGDDVTREAIANVHLVGFELPSWCQRAHMRR